MQEWMPRYGHLAAFVLGAAVIVSYILLRPDPALLVAGFVLTIFGAAAGTLKTFSAGPKGFLVEFQRQTLREVHRLLQRQAEDDLGLADQVEAKVIRAEGHGTAFNADVVITEAKSPAEFAELVIGEAQIIQVPSIPSQAQVFAPTVIRQPPEATEE